MVNYSPGGVPLRDGGHRHSRDRVPTNIGDRRIKVRHKICLPRADRELNREMPVGAKSGYIELAEFPLERRNSGIDQRDEDFAPGIRGYSPKFFFFSSQDPRYSVNGIISSGAAFAIPREVERMERLFFIRVGQHANDLLNLKHFEVNRPGSFRDDVKFRKSIGNEDRIEPLRKEVDHRRAKERDTVSIDAVVQLGLGSLESNHDFQIIPVKPPHGRQQACQLKEEESLRTSKILFEEPVPLEAARPLRKQCLFLNETDSSDC